VRWARRAAIRHDALFYVTEDSDRCLPVFSLRHHISAMTSILTEDPLKLLYREDFHLQHLQHGIRTDGRLPEAFRTISYLPTTLSTCTRAFIVRWGDAMLLGGIRPEVAPLPPIKDSLKDNSFSGAVSKQLYIFTVNRLSSFYFMV